MKDYSKNISWIVDSVPEITENMIEGIISNTVRFFFI